MNNIEDLYKSLNLNHDIKICKNEKEEIFYETCHVFGKIPLVPDDTLRLGKRTNKGVLLDVLYNNQWVSVGEIHSVFLNLYKPDKVNIVCLKPDIYEVPLKMTIYQN